MFTNKTLSIALKIFLVVLFVYNSFGYLLLYFPVQTIIKHVVQKSIHEKKIKPEDLSVLVFSIKGLDEKKYDFIWEKPGKEFRFNDKMYDIEDKVIIGDTIFYTVYYDHKENILEELFSIHQLDNKKDKTQNLAQKVLLVGFYYEEINNIYSKIEQNTSTNMPLKKNEADFLNHIFDVPTPPPRKIV
jgi:hypothetical protein